jgi:nitroreductase
MNDPYQEAYLLHQARKKQQILQYKSEPFAYLAESRHSCRVFKSDPVPSESISRLASLLNLAPSSCNRKAVSSTLYSSPLISPLESLLVGGRAWLGNAPNCLLIFADPLAYKAPGELSFMPYLDSGFYAMNALYALHSLNLGACFINPNIRESDLPVFSSTYNPASLIFTGALAFGLPQ